MGKYVLTVTLNPALDKTLVVRGFTIGRDFREEGLSVSAGGKGINVSRALKLLGVATLATGFIGGPTGDIMRRRLKQERIPHHFYPIAENSRTSTTVLDPLKNTITRVLEQGPEVSHRELAGFRNTYRSLLSRATYVVFSGRNIPGAPDCLYADLIAMAKKANVFTILDTSGRPARLGIMARPDMIKPNRKEAEKLVQRRLNTTAQIVKTVNDLRKRGVGIVALTEGSRGAVCANSKELLTVIPPRLRAKNPVGCGDAFIAGFLSARIRGKSFAESARFAAACGTANVTSVDPGIIAIPEVRRLLRLTKVTTRSS